MHLPTLARLLLAAGALAPGVTGAASAGCEAHSGQGRGVLLELYTSEGCDSCPPADRRLSALKARADLGGKLVPLAFHVDYWDRLGWKDRYGSAQYTERQYAMAALARSRQVYTPQFLRNGRDWRGGDPLDGVPAGPAAAAISLRLASDAGGILAIDGEARMARPGLEAWLAVYEHKLESAVGAGENAGRTLRHDYVVRRLIGPLAPGPDGRVALRRQLALDPTWKRPDLGVVAFAQDRASGEVVQALQRHACAG